MTYEQALAIAAQNAPDLIVMSPFRAHPYLFAVQKTKDGAPFSIDLPKSIDANLTPEEALAAETEMLIFSLKAAERVL